MFPKKSKKQKHKYKPYHTPKTPGEKIQIDVKFVPSSCLLSDLKSTKLYPYTAVDKATSFSYLSFSLQCVQTDNGFEFTNCLISEKKSLFEETLLINEIQYHPIRPATPRHNGKVERSHREDQKRFYDKTTCYSLEDTYKQLKKLFKEI